MQVAGSSTAGKLLRSQADQNLAVSLLYSKNGWQGNINGFHLKRFYYLYKLERGYVDLGGTGNSNIQTWPGSIFTNNSVHFTVILQLETFSHSKAQTSSALHMNEYIEEKVGGRLKKTIVSWKNAVNMIGEQRKNTSLKNWAFVLPAETVQCALSEMRGSVVGKSTLAVSSGTQIMADVWNWDITV